MIERVIVLEDGPHLLRTPSFYALDLMAEDGLFLINHIAATFHEHDDRRRARVRVRTALVATLAQEATTLAAVRMALHRRSTGAAIRILGPDLLLACVRGARRERIVLWEEVLAEWLQPLVTAESEREQVLMGGEEEEE